MVQELFRINPEGMTIIWKEFVAFVFGAMVRAWGVSQKRKREEDKHGLRISQSWTFALCLPTEQHHWKTVQDEDGQEHFQGPKGSQNSLSFILLSKPQLSHQPLQIQSLCQCPSYCSKLCHSGPGH
jgi:hypothetical protein